MKQYGIDLGTQICQKLLASKLVNTIHFYTLNLEKSTLAVMDNLGLKKSDTAVGDELENTLKGTLISTVIKA